eukprot:gene3373-3648_t
MADQQAIWACFDSYDPFSGLPVPGGLSERLWADCQQQALEALHHPFITALASGTMNRSCFQHYILQDAFFLNYYAKTYAAALDKMHGAYAAKWGVTLEEGLRPSAATCAYTDFLTDIAHDLQASIAEVLAAMVPCSRLYGFLGCRLAAASAGRPRHAYSEWVDTYSSVDYLSGRAMSVQLVKQLQPQQITRPHCVLRAPKTTLLRRLQNKCNNGYIRLLVVDFDDTATEKDTIGVLMNAATLSNFDSSMNQVVIDDGCLKGLTVADLAAAGATIKLRPRCAATIATAAAGGIPVAVLSVNWSKTLMQAALTAGAAADQNKLLRRALAAFGPPPVLTIAGSDSGGGAGIQADTKTIMANGGFAMTVVTALTAQNSTGVQGVHRTPGEFLEQQLDSIFSDLPPAAIKTALAHVAGEVAVICCHLHQQPDPLAPGC